MYIKKSLVCVLIIFCCIFMSGCGEELKELTEEEEDIITLYAAKVVAKHNVRLSQGIVRYKGSDDADEEDTEEETDGADADTDDAAEEASDTPQEQPTEDGGQPAETAEETTASTADPVSLTDAMSMDQITFSFKGASVPESLRLSSYYTLPDPAAGKNYVIVTYEVRNASDTARNVSIASLRPVFTAEIDGESSTAGIVLEDDLATYEGVIDAGGAEDLIILFEVSEQAASDLSALNLSVNVNGTSYPLIL